MLNRGNKHPRTQVNDIEDDGEEKEPENGEQAPVHLIGNITSRQGKEKRSRTDQEPESVAVNAAFAARTNSLEPGLGVV